ncbi:MAG: hypothetical protein AB7P00_39505 [Sandaracinaceae bacterium]
MRGVRHIDRWDIDLSSPLGPMHAIFIGPSGSGKTSVLVEIERELGHAIGGVAHPAARVEGMQGDETAMRLAFFGRPVRLAWTRAGEIPDAFQSGRWIAASLPAVRAVMSSSGTMSAGAPAAFPPEARLAGRLGELMIQRKSEARMAEARSDERIVKRLDGWLDGVTAVFREMLGDEGLAFVVGRDNLAIDFSDGRRLPFLALASGHAHAVNVWAELFMRAESARAKTADPTHQPRGVLLVDGAELYLDQRLQRSLLPTLVAAFPGVQLLVTTTSPIVAASLPHASVLDLGTRRARSSPSIPPVAALPRRSSRPPPPTSVRPASVRPLEGPDTDPPPRPEEGTETMDITPELEGLTEAKDTVRNLRPVRPTQRGPGWDDD